MKIREIQIKELHIRYDLAILNKDE